MVRNPNEQLESKIRRTPQENSRRGVSKSPRTWAGDKEIGAGSRQIRDGADRPQEAESQKQTRGRGRGSVSRPTVQQSLRAGGRHSA